MANGNKPLGSRPRPVVSGMKSILAVNSATNNELRRAISALQESEQRFRALFEMGPVAVYSCDVSGVIDNFNRRAVELWGRAPKPGDTDERFCGSHKLFLPDGTYMPHHQCPMAQVVSGKVSEVHDAEVVIERPDGSRVTVIVNIRPLTDQHGQVTGAINCFYDITGRKKMEEALTEARDTLESRVRERTKELEDAQGELRNLSSRLLQLQDAERRRIARELHDGAGQILAALAMNIARIKQKVRPLSPELMELMDESDQMAQGLTQEIRTTSYLLHPPLLDETGLCGAIRWYVQGLTERSGLKIQLDLPENLGRLPSELELAIFRILQECLTNIHRHSGSGTATVRFSRKPDDGILLEIEDHGKGIPPEILRRAHAGGTGVGLGGMRERVRHFQGEMNIASNENGTKISIMVPAQTAAIAKDQRVLQQKTVANSL